MLHEATVANTMSASGSATQSDFLSHPKLRLSSAVLSAIVNGQPQVVIVEVAKNERAKVVGSPPEHLSALEAASQVQRLQREAETSKHAAFSGTTWYSKSAPETPNKSQALTDIALHRDYEFLPIVALKVSGTSALASLLNNAHVLAVYENQSHQPTLAQSLPLIRQDLIARLGAGNGDGLGRSVVVMDTGTDYMNGYFGSCSQSEVSADLGLTNSSCRIAYQSDLATNDGQLDDDPVKHGTNVSGIVLGVAPRAKVVSFDMFQSTDCSSGAPLPASVGRTSCDDGVIRAFNWSIQNKDRYKIVAINMSFGDKRSYASRITTSLSSVTQSAKQVGIATVVSAGNNAYRSGVFVDGVSGYAASSADVISVGATYDSFFASGSGRESGSECNDFSPQPSQVVCFSQTSSFLSVLAPGYQIEAGGTNMPLPGTSQAAPHVAGAFAALSSLFPTESIGQLTARITGRGPTIYDNRTGRSHKRLDLYAAASNDLTIRSYRAGAASFGVQLELSSGGRVSPEDGETIAVTSISTLSPYILRWFVAQKPITLTAPAADFAGATFTQWTGCDSTNAATRQCTITVNSSRGIEVYYGSAPPLVSSAISVSPTSIAFGNVTTGTTATKILTVSNAGSSALSLTQAPAVSGSFSIGSGTTCVAGTQIASNQSCQLVVSFTPSSASIYAGSVSIFSNASNASNSSTNVPITGAGVVVAATCTFSVFYDAGGPSYGGDISLSAAPQPTSFALRIVSPAGCAWSASSSAPTWLTSGSSGSGDGTVSAQIAENFGFARIGSLSIGSRTVTVQQGAYYPANGACGIANGQTLPSAPTTGLCAIGLASAVTGVGPWSWSCGGIAGGANAYCSASAAPSSTSATKSMVEYYYAALNYYFITSDTREMQSLDSIVGWSRTGATFKVFSAPTAGANGVNRYYFDQVARNQSRGSHFYTLIDSEKIALNALNPNNLRQPRLPVDEGVNSYAYLPQSGVCPAGTTPIYRLFRGNARFPDDPNHRFTTDRAVYQNFVSAGWDGEGVGFCAPQ